MRQLLYYKLPQTFVTKCVRFFVTKCDGFITKCDVYYKLRQYSSDEKEEDDATTTCKICKIPWREVSQRRGDWV